MRSSRPALLLFVFTLLSLSFGLAQSQPAADNPVKAADIAFAQATKDRGLEGWMSFFADDAYAGTKPSVQGKEDLRKFYQGLFARRDLKFEWAPDQAQVFASGIMGYTSGRYTMSFTNFKGEPVSQSGSYVTIWQKQPDGSWKVLSDFGSQDKPPVTPVKNQTTSDETPAAKQ
jgi:ketosteroid isomerase-like protein